MGKLLDRLKAIAEGSGASIEATDDRLSEVITKIENSGGGSSDFSIAQVTVQSMQGASALFPVAYEDGEYSGMYAQHIYEAEAGTYPVVLYKGMAYIDGAFTVVSGNATAYDNFITVQGDCTIAAEKIL